MDDASANRSLRARSPGLLVELLEDRRLLSGLAPSAPPFARVPSPSGTNTFIVEQATRPIVSPVAAVIESGTGRINPAAEVVGPIPEAVRNAVGELFALAAEALAPVVEVADPTVEPTPGPATVIGAWAAEALGIASRGGGPIGDPIGMAIGPAPEPIRQAIGSVAGGDEPVVVPYVSSADPILGLVKPVVRGMIEPLAAFAAPIAEPARPIVEPATGTVVVPARAIGPIIEPSGSLADSLAPDLAFAVDPPGRERRPGTPDLVPIAAVVGPSASPPSSVGPTMTATRPSVGAGGSDAGPIGPVDEARVERLSSRADSLVVVPSPSDLESLGQLLLLLLGRGLGRDGGSAALANQADGGASTASPISGRPSMSMIAVPVLDRIGPRADSGGGGLEGLWPRSAPPRCGARPLDVGSLDRALGQLLAWLDDLGETLASRATLGDLLAWIMAVALVSAACEIARRDLRRCRLGTGLDGLLPIGSEAP